jgi:ABC-2 type transport system permease protein
LAAEAVASRGVRVARAVRAEAMKAFRQPTLAIYLLLAVVVTAVAGPVSWSIKKGQEEEFAPAAESASEVTHTFDEEVQEPPAESGESFDLSTRGANGYLVLAAGFRAGMIVAAILFLLYSATMLAGEGTAGTWRMLLVRPVTRTDVLLAKTTVLFLVIVAFVIVLAATGWVAGLVVGGYGDYVDVRFGQVDYTSAELATVAVKCIALAPLALLAVAAFGLFCSSLFDNSSTAITAAILAGLAAAAMNLGLSEDNQMLNFVTYIDHYAGIFEAFSRGLSEFRFDLRLLRPGLLIPPVSALVFLLGARTIFARRDIHA